MRKTFYLVYLVIFLGVAVPAEAQFRGDVPAGPSPSKLYDTGALGFVRNTLFNPAHFKMSHGYEMSFGSFGGHTSSVGMYTNTMQWQFNDKFAARVDMSVAFTPFGGGAFGQEQDNTRFFLRNAEIVYRPNDKVQFFLQIRQSPYGAYASPYGYYSPYFGRSGYGYMNVGYGGGSHDLFWREARH